MNPDFWQGFLIDTLPLMATLAMGVAFCVLIVRYFCEPVYPDLRFVPLIQKLRLRYLLRRIPDVWPDENAEEVQEPAKAAPEADIALCPPLERAIPLDRPTHLRPIAWVLLMTLASRLLIFGTVAIGFAARGELQSFFDHFYNYWVRWDAPHYMGLAERWYVNVGDPRFHIVFFPLYPALTKGLSFLLGGQIALSGIVLSNLCLLGSGWLLYLLMRTSYGESAARRAVRYLMFCPVSVFFSAPYTESLFLMLTLLAVYCARRRRFGWAVFAGALAANTRSLGILIAVPIYLEMLKHIAERRLWPEQKKRYIGQLAKYTGMVALVLLGFVAYLYINWQTFGNPTQFMIFQREHWGQEFGSIGNTLRYTLEYAFDYDAFWRFGTWIPQSFCIVISIVLLCAVAHRVYPGEGAYGWLYLIGALSPTFLLSGARYIGGMYALYPMLALITRKKWQDALLMAVFVPLCALGGYMYAVIGNLL